MHTTLNKLERVRVSVSTTDKTLYEGYRSSLKDLKPKYVTEGTLSINGRFVVAAEVEPDSPEYETLRSYIEHNLLGSDVQLSQTYIYG